MPAVVLILYGVFFSSTGLNQMALSTLQGKLLVPTVRGRNLLWSSTVGALIAVVLAWLLLPAWLEGPGGRFDYIFGFTGLCFLLSALLVPLIVEPRDEYDVPKMRWRDHFWAAIRILRRDANFRRLAIVAMLFSTVLNLFPHYQRFAFERFGFELDAMLPWVVAQNIGVGMYSLVAGPLADRRGNRITLQLLVVCAAAAPILTVSFTQAPSVAHDWFWVVFLLLGLTPITIRTLYNYTLEICPVADHPRYLSTLSLCMAVPLFFSPLTGEMGDSAGFEQVFIVGAVLILLGGLVTFTLIEPRHRKIETVEPAAVVPDDSTFPGGTV
jgi:MFS family permease